MGLWEVKYRLYWVKYSKTACGRNYYMYEVSSLAYAYQQVFNIYHSKSIKEGHYQLASEAPLEWCFSGGPIEARQSLLAGA